jgi:hypothetical protein
VLGFPFDLGASNATVGNSHTLTVIPVEQRHIDKALGATVRIARRWRFSALPDVCLC